MARLELDHLELWNLKLVLLEDIDKADKRTAGGATARLMRGVLAKVEKAMKEEREG
jgi:hypothetical protein